MTRLIVLTLIQIIAIGLLIECAGTAMHPAPVTDPYRPLYALIGLYLVLLVLVYNTWNIVRQVKYMASL